MLKSFAKVQGTPTLGPSLLDVDDWEVNRSKISFYVMDYLQGIDFLSFIEQKGKSWMPILILQLLNDLANLHDNGWVFGDLKPENLIVTGPPPKIRCIDVGGTTVRGRAIKEFTEFYDRGYWGLGSRKAEPSYDLFAVAMIMINTAYPKRFKKTIGGLKQLTEAICQKPELTKFNKVMIKALQGHYSTAIQMRTELLAQLTQPKQDDRKQPSAVPITKKSNKSAKSSPPLSRQHYRKTKKRKGWMDFFVILAFLGALYGFYIFTKLL